MNEKNESNSAKFKRKINAHQLSVVLKIRRKKGVLVDLTKTAKRKKSSCLLKIVSEDSSCDLSMINVSVCDNANGNI